MTREDAARIFDRENTLRRVDGDIGLLQRLYRHFIEERPRFIESLNDSLARNDFDALQETAHSLKGAAIAIGASIVGETLFSLEIASKDRDAETCRRLIERLDGELELFDQEMQKVLQE